MALTCLINGTIHTGITVLEESDIIIENELIKDVLSPRRFAKMQLPPDTRIINLAGAHAAPGFIDTHIHGIGGYGTEDRTPQAILKISEILPRYGVTGFCPTIYPQAHQDILDSIRAIVSAMGREEGARIIGLHLEGPFISPEKSGIHRTEHMQRPDIALMEEFWRASGGRIVSMTVAPELKGMRELSHYCIGKGIVLQAGHSNASYEQMVEGIQSGIIHSTHFFNAMRSLHHRDPGVAGAILIHPEVSCEIIPDGFHVHPALIRLLVGGKPKDKIVMVTDALKPTMQTDEPLIANGEEVYDNKGIFRRKSDGVIAGSSLTMTAGAAYLVKQGFPIDQVLHMASRNPAQILHLQKDRGYLLPGYKADITVLNAECRLRLTMMGGRIIYESKSA